MELIPLVEKFRPKNFDDVVLCDTNKKILNNIISFHYFPNLLLYGPPGTGKTSTITNLINSYHKNIGITNNKDLIIHLNASDDRGIDIIRNQISQFVSSNTIFKPSTYMKFVILDEADYMTKNAQQALRCIIQNYYKNVRFCIICNYISKIDEALQTEFLCIRYGPLNKTDIISFLNKINKQEKLEMTNQELESIQKKYGYDIRSMINFIQSSTQTENNIFTGENDFEKLYNLFIISPKKRGKNKLNTTTPEHIQELSQEITNLKYKKGEVEKLNKIREYLKEMSKKIRTDEIHLLRDFVNYLVRTKPEIITVCFLKKISTAFHNHINYNNLKCDIYKNYLLLCVFDLFISKQWEK